MRLIKQRMIWAILAMTCACLLFAGCGDQESRKAAYFSKGQELFDAGDDARARLEFKNTLQIDNRFAEAWYMLGRVEQRAGDLQKAYENYSRAVELSPEMIDARVSKAQILLVANELDAAQQEIDAALAIVPTHADAIVARGALRKRQGDLEGALADARSALGIDAKSAGAAALLAGVELDRGAFEESVSVLQDAIAANPDMPNLRLLLGRVYERQGSAPGVLEVLRGLVERFPEDTDYRFRLASYLVKLERIDDAETVLRETLSLAPSDLERQRALLEFLLRTKGIAAAQAEVGAMLATQNDGFALRLLEAELLRAAGDLAGAESALREILQDVPSRSPDAIAANSILGQLLIDTGRDAEADDLIAAVLEQSPAEPDFLELRAALALKSGDPAQAIVDLRAVLDGYPDRASAYRSLGLAHRQREEYALAQDALEQSIRLAPDQPPSYLELAELRAEVGDNQGALTVLERLLAQAPDNTSAQERIARIQLSVQDWGALAETAHRIQIARPDHPLGFYLEGLALQQQARDTDAVGLFEAALERNPDATSPRVALARSKMSLGAWDDAREEIATLLQSHPRHFAARALLGELYLATGAVEQARATLEEVVRFHPTSPRGYALLAQFHVKQGDWEAARATLEKGIDATDQNGYLVLQNAMLLDELGERDASMLAYESLLARYPDALIAVNNLAALLVRGSSDPAKLDRALELAVRLRESEIPEFLDTLGWVHFQRGEYVEALPYLEQAVAGKPGHPEMRYHLGLIYAKLGRTEDAKKHLWLAATAEDFSAQSDARREFDALNSGSE